MTWHVRFRRRIRILPGLWLNVAKRGISASAGVRGLTVNSRGRTTVSAPGAGLSVTSSTPSRPRGRHLTFALVLVLLAAIAAFMWAGAA